MKWPLFAILYTLAGASPYGHAEENAASPGDALSGSATEIQAPTDAGGPSGHSAPEPEEEAPAHPRRDVSAGPVVSKRFNLIEEERFRQWMLALCRDEAVAPEASAQRRFLRDGVSTRTPRNKQGSLLLVLENYVENMELRDDCAKKRKTDPRACRVVNRAPTNVHAATQWLGRGTWKFSAPAGDPASVAAENMTRYPAALRANFYELRELGDLNGKSETLALARKIILAVKDHSPCQTRAVVEKFQAQK